MACVFTAVGAVTTYLGCSASNDDGSPGHDAGSDRSVVCVGAGCQDAGQPWTPAALKPELWLDGDDVVMSGSVVARWKDQSGNGNDALPGTNDSGAPTPPTIKAFQGHQAISFDGTTKMSIADVPSLRWGIEDFAIFAVVRYTGIVDPWAGIVYLKTTISNPYFGAMLWAQSPGSFLLGTGSESRLPTATPNDAGSDDGRPHLVMLRRTGANVDLRLDRASAGQIHVAPEDISAPGITAKIGGQDNIQFIKGDIAMLVGARGTVTDDDVAQMETYVLRRYGF